jgi:YHS domain-containing protein
MPTFDHRNRIVPLLVLASATFLCLAPRVPSPAWSQPGGGPMPSYDDEGRLELPPDYRRWVLVGSSLGLSYSEGEGGMEMFHETLMEPTAYDHFSRTGEFREGTMLVLLLHGVGENVSPQRRGRFAAEIHGVEMAVKDGTRSERGWEYYGFGGMNGIRDRATAVASEACYECHRTEAAHDNVFVQFYPLLTDVAPAGTVYRSSTGKTMELATPPSVEPTGAPVALGGLDPVLLVEGRRELGKPEIVATHDSFAYQFVSEPTRARFAADPARYSFQNESCLVVPGATLEPDIFAVHEGRIYGFATHQCASDFTLEPERYLPPREPAADG